MLTLAGRPTQTDSCSMRSVAVKGKTHFLCTMKLLDMTSENRAITDVLFRWVLRTVADNFVPAKENLQ